MGAGWVYRIQMPDRRWLQAIKLTKNGLMYGYGSSYLSGLETPSYTEALLIANFVKGKVISVTDYGDWYVEHFKRIWPMREHSQDFIVRGAYKKNVISALKEKLMEANV